MKEERRNHISKFLSLVLRHKPETIGITLENEGWADVAVLLDKSEEHIGQVSVEDLNEVVITNDKKRFAFNHNGTKIRASQGHSIEVDLQLIPMQPPQYLYHGTVDRFIDAIKKEGLQKMSRQHVHLSTKVATAEKVGARRGKPVILLIRSREMRQAGMIFYLSDNEVWLTDNMPSEFIEF